MKPSQFKRIEKNAEKQWRSLNDQIKNDQKTGNYMQAAEKQETLKNLVSTMKNLKPKK